MSQESREARREAYRKKLKDPRWQKMRLKVFERDKFECQFCGVRDETLHVHHLYYCADCEPWEYPDEALITLCESCHEAEGVCRRPAEDDLLRILRITGFSSADLACLAGTLSVAKFCCAKRDFLEFFDWMMIEAQEEHVRGYFENGLPSEWPRDDHIEPPW